MAYDDDDDLFGEEFDFVDDDEHGDDEDEKAKDEPAPKKKRPASRDKDKADKPPTRGPKRARPSNPVNKREPRREPADPNNKAGDGIAGPPGPPPKPPVERAPVGYIIDDVPPDDEPSEVEPEPAPAQASGPPSDHLVHIYEYGNFKRTIARKFTDEEAVGFAEEYTRTGKPYGRYAIATPDDEEPAPTFAGAAKG
jgi:hypothetical protein